MAYSHESRMLHKLQTNCSPEDPLDVLELGYFYTLFTEAKIFTIRQFASSDLNGYVEAGILKNADDLKEKHKVAQRFLNNFRYSAPVQVHTGDILYGYLYVSEEVKQQIIDEQVLKSPYVLFEEYMKCSAEQRIHHPWHNVFYRHLGETADKLQCDPYKVNDLDVYGFLTWRASKSWGEHDYTAGARAIYFHWFYLMPKVHAECMEMDRAMSQTLQNPYYAQRYEVLLRINLTEMLNRNLGKMYRWEPDTPSLWYPVNLQEGIRRSERAANINYKFIPGDSLFDTLPYACIVTPTGTIEASLIDEVTIVPNAP